MPKVTWAVVATRSPMGQQRYEIEIQKALSAVASAEWKFELARLGSLRSDIPGIRRFPAGLLGHAGLPMARAIGAACYRTRGVVHRFDLRLPPAPHVEVLTVHDLPPLRFDDEGAVPKGAAAGARNAKVVIVPSSFAAGEVVSLLDVEEARIRVIPYGVSDDYRSGPAASEEELQSLGVSVPFCLHAAGATERKNLAGLARAWARLNTRGTTAQLVLAGPPDSRRDAYFDQVPNAKRVGRLEAGAVARLMRRAAAVVVPSVYEGFGLPALEGMACGAPVVAANAGALPEVCGDAALLADPTGDALSSAIERVLDDAQLADALRAAGPRRAAAFSWTSAAEATLEVYSAATCGS
jgi:glycosyltransferase involved in cell wall biosynthesis